MNKSSDNRYKYCGICGAKTGIEDNACLSCGAFCQTEFDSSLSSRLNGYYFATDDGETIRLFKTVQEARQNATLLGGQDYYIGQILGNNLLIAGQTRHLSFPQDRF